MNDHFVIALNRSDDIRYRFAASPPIKFEEFRHFALPDRRAGLDRFVSLAGDQLPEFASAEKRITSPGS